MPRKPDPTLPKRPVGRPKGSTKNPAGVSYGPSAAQTAAPQVSSNVQPTPTFQPPPPTGKRLNLTPYPDLSMAIAMLQRRLNHVGNTRAELIEKWVISLAKIHEEIVRLRKLEQLTDHLTTNTDKPNL